MTACCPDSQSQSICACIRRPRFIIENSISTGFPMSAGNTTGGAYRTRHHMHKNSLRQKAPSRCYNVPVSSMRVFAPEPSLLVVVKSSKTFVPQNLRQLFPPSLFKWQARSWFCELPPTTSNGMTDGWSFNVSKDNGSVDADSVQRSSSGKDEWAH